MEAPLFIAYVIFLIQVAMAYSLLAKKIALGFLASLVPFVFEAKLKKGNPGTRGTHSGKVIAR